MSICLFQDRFASFLFHMKIYFPYFRFHVFFLFLLFQRFSDDSPSESIVDATLQLTSFSSSPEDLSDLSALSLEEENLLAPSLEVFPSLSVCGNIHQAQYFPFWTDVLKCGAWHRNILREGLRLDFIDGILPSDYDERNNLSARREPAFVCDSLDSMSSSGIINHVLASTLSPSPLVTWTPGLASSDSAGTVLAGSTLF